VTGLKNIQAEVQNIDYLNTQNKYLKALIDASPMGMAVIDSFENIIYSNNIFVRVTGLTHNNIKINQSHKNLKYILPGGREMSFNELKNSFKKHKGKILKKIIVGIIHSKEKVIWNEVTTAPVEYDKNLSLLIAKDVTEKINLRKDLIDIESRYKSLYENSLDAIFLTSPDGTIHSANPAACRLFQMTEEEICQRGRDGIVDLNDPRLAHNLEERSKTGRFYGELNMVKSTGEIFPVELSTSVYTFSGLEYTSIIIRDISERKRTENKINKLTEELKNLTHHLQDSLENERRQIAAELHDDLGQKLTAIKLYCSSLTSKKPFSSPEEEIRINEIMRLLDESVEGIHKVSMGLRPVILEDLGICPAIEWLVNDFTKTTGIECNVAFEPQEIQLQSDTSLVIFRCVQESLTNITKHSGATEASIFLRAFSDTLILFITDNGIGIQLEKIDNRKSFGITGMRERVENIGGELKISSVPGKETQLKIVIPVLKKRFS
jgi:PAS domain S-box-containing protein